MGTLAALLVAPAPAASQALSRELDALMLDAAEMALRKGAALAEQGRWEEARRAFERAIAWTPSAASAHHNLGVALTELGRDDEAIAAYREARRLAPRAVQTMINLGVELARTGRPAEAQAVLQDAARVAPGAAAVHHNLGVVLGTLQRFDEAFAELHLAARLDPGASATRQALADTHYNRGVFEASRQNWTAALSSYETALQFNRELPEALHGAGVVLSRLGQDRRAVPMFEEALRQRPGYAEVRYNLARSFAVLGRYAEAVEACRTALSARPSLRPALELLDAIHRLYIPSLVRLFARAVPWSSTGMASIGPGPL